jgi:hypothetical protein
MGPRGKFGGAAAKTVPLYQALYGAFAKAFPFEVAAAIEDALDFFDAS